jgi:hypothetical protein
MAGMTQVHVDQALSNVSVAYRNAAFVAERVAPVVPVQKQNDLYFQFSKQHFRTVVDNLRPGDDANEIEVDLDTRGSYRCDGHGLGLAIPDELRANADPGAQIDIEYTEKITSQLLLNQEVALAAIVTSTTNIGAGNYTNLASTPTLQWGTGAYTTSDPREAVDAAKETIQQNIGEFPNCLLLPRPVFRSLRNHPRILDAFKYTMSGARSLITAEQMAEYFDVEEVIVPASLKQANPEGEADSLSYIWGNNALLFYRPRRPGLRVPAFAYTFLWVGNGISYMVKRFRLETRDSDYLKIKKYYAQQIVAQGAAYLWQNAI